MPSLARNAGTVAGGGLGHRGGQRSALVVLGDRERGEVGGGAGPLERDQHVGELVLDRLERADGHAELLALLGVVERHVEDRLAGADHLERERQWWPPRRAALDRGGRGRAGLAEHAVRADASRRRGRRGRGGRLASSAAIGVAVAALPGTTNTPIPSSPARPAHAGHDRDLVGRAASTRCGVDALEHGTVGAARAWPSRRVAGRSPRPAMQVPVRSPAATGAQERGLLRRPSPPPAPSGRTARRWRGTARARSTRPSSSSDDRELDHAEPEPAVLLRHRQRRPAERDHLRPQAVGGAPFSTTSRTRLIGHSRTSTARTASRSSSWSGVNSSSMTEASG